MKESLFRRLSRHYAFVVAGFGLSVFSFALLLTFFLLSVATVVIWVGALLFPFTLMVATGFAELDRRRLHLQKVNLRVTYKPLGRGVLAKLRIITDARRWLDLVFEMLIALPLRLVTFTLTMVWTFAGLSGVTYFFWSVFVPGERSVIQLLEITEPQLIPSSSGGQYALDSGAHFLLGVVFLATLPVMMRLFASVDAAVTGALLQAGGHSDASTVAHQGRSASSTPSFSSTAWSWLGAGLVTVVLVAVAWPLTAALYGVPVAIAMVLVLAHCGAILLTLYQPWMGLALSVLAAGATMVATVDSGVTVWPWSVTALITQCVVLVIVAMARPWYYAVAAWCLTSLLTLIAVLVMTEIPPGAISNAIVGVSVSASVVLIGALLRTWILNMGRLEAAERTSAEQGRRSKELTERNRIARELHDVVAHSMSVISVQASTAPYRHPGMGETARGEFAEIAASSRQALGEMRMLLSILRGDDEVPTAPEPGLADIDALIEATRASGTSIGYRGLDRVALDRILGAEQTGTVVTSATGLAAYRIIQEALSNALRHAPGAEVEVDLYTQPLPEGDQQLHCVVANLQPPGPVGEPSPGAGLGLSGMTERSAAVGGSVSYGPTPQGGFRVHATLPL